MTFQEMKKEIQDLKNEIQNQIDLRKKIISKYDEKINSLAVAFEFMENHKKITIDILAKKFVN